MTLEAIHIMKRGGKKGISALPWHMNHNVSVYPLTQVMFQTGCLHYPSIHCPPNTLKIGTIYAPELQRLIKHINVLTIH